MIQKYLLAVWGIFSFALIFGLIVPSLVSTKSDIAVVLGFIIALAYPVAGILTWRFYIKHSSNKGESE